MSTSRLTRLALAAAAVAVAGAAAPAPAEPDIRPVCRLELREQTIVEGDGTVPDVSIWRPYCIG